MQKNISATTIVIAILTGLLLTWTAAAEMQAQKANATIFNLGSIKKATHKVQIDKLIKITFPKNIKSKVKSANQKCVAGHGVTCKKHRVITRHRGGGHGGNGGGPAPPPIGNV